MELERKQQLIAWVDARIEEAEKAALDGDLSKINALGKNWAFSYYINNVYFTHSIPRKSFMEVQNYMQEFERLHEAELREIQRENDLKEATEKNAAFEAKLAEQAAQIEKLMAFFEDAQAKATKAAKKAKADDKPADAPVVEDQMDTEDA